jgi:hypothetical protein
VRESKPLDIYLVMVSKPPDRFFIYLVMVRNIIEFKPSTFEEAAG